MSSAAISPRSRVGLAIYASAALLFALEAGVVWLMLHPNVPEDFRAYYIDRTTTCLNQPVSGAYAFGTTVSFLPEGVDVAKPLRVCGWEGPAGDGTHAVGTSSRLRFVGTASSGPQVLQLELAAVTKDGVVQPQRVDVVVDGEPVGQLRVDEAEPDVFSLALPADVTADGHVEMLLEFPDAVRMGRTDPDTRWRSVKLTSAGVVPAR